MAQFSATSPWIGISVSVRLPPLVHVPAQRTRQTNAFAAASGD